MTPDWTELSQENRALRAENRRLKKAIREQIVFSDLTYDQIDSMAFGNEEDKDLLLAMVTVPGLKDALKRASD